MVFGIIHVAVQQVIWVQIVIRSLIIALVHRVYRVYVKTQRIVIHVSVHRHLIQVFGVKFKLINVHRIHVRTMQPVLTD